MGLMRHNWGGVYGGNLWSFMGHVNIMGLNGVDKGILEFGWFIGFNGIV